MTTNKPTTYWAPSTALAKLASRHNNAPCVLTDGPAEFNDVALIRLSDYEALQAECEKLRKAAEISAADANDAERELETVKAECEKLRNLLRHAQPIIKAHAEASHMLEGFRPRRNKWDELVEGIHAVMQEPSHENQ